MIVISNASPLIALSSLDRLVILAHLFEVVYIPDTVYRETVTNNHHWQQRTRIHQATNAFIEILQPKRHSHFSRHLGAGEQGVLTLALERSAEVVLLDDTKARHEAQEIGVLPVFTSDILKRAAWQQLIPSYEEMLTELRRQQIYLPE